MSLENAPVEASQERDAKSATSHKTAACAVNLGVSILNELVGGPIGDVSSENANELMAAAINSELKL